MTTETDQKFDQILFERREASGWLSLNRPHARNATTLRMFDEMEQVFEVVRRDRAIRALVLTGAGESFCIGSDLGQLEKAMTSESLAVFRDYLMRINNVLFALESLPVPTIAMINGRARAGGFEMLLACDFVITAHEALLGDVHTPFGHMPGAGATQRLPRKIGMQRALEIILSGKWLTGQEAVAYGIAISTAPLRDLVSVTESFVRQFTTKPRDCVSQAKRAALSGSDLPLRAAVDLEVQTYLELLATSDEPKQMFLQNLRNRAVGKPDAASSRVTAM